MSKILVTGAAGHLGRLVIKHLIESQKLSPSDIVAGSRDPAKLTDYRNRLDALEEEAVQLSVPLAFTDLVYTLREHVNLVRRILDKKESQA